MSTCSKNLIGKAEAQYSALAKEIGDDKATAIFKMYDGFEKNKADAELKYRSALMKTYPEIKVSYSDNIKYRDVDVFNQQELSEMTAIADKFNVDLLGIAQNEKDKAKLKTLDKESNEYKSLMKKHITSKYTGDAVISLGTPQAILKGALGLPDKPIIISKNELLNHILKDSHDLDINDLHNLVRAINNPIAVFSDAPKYNHSTKSAHIRANSFEILTELRNKKGKMIKSVITINSNKYSKQLDLKITDKFNDLTTTYSVDDKLNSIKDHVRLNRTLFVNKTKMIPIFERLKMNDTSADKNKSEVNGDKHRKSRTTFATKVDQLINKVNLFENKSVDEVLFQRTGSKVLGQADVRAMTVLINAREQKLDTLPHEFAHHYIAAFRDTDIVQEGISRFGSEESLVQAIGEQYVTQDGEIENWWSMFTNWLLSSYSDNDVKKILTNAFITRTDLNRSLKEIHNAIDDSPANGEDFFKVTSVGKASKLYSELKIRGLNPVSYFSLALSDKFIKENGNWIAQQKKDIVSDDLYKDTIEPKIEKVLNYSLSLSIGTDTNITPEDVSVQEVHDEITFGLANVFKSKYGVDFKFVPGEDAKDGAKAWYSQKDNTMSFVNNRVTLDSAVHEMAHPIIEMFKRDNPDAYASLVVDLKNYKDEEWYKQVLNKYEGLSAVKMYDELLVTAIGLNAANKLNTKRIQESNKTWLDKLTDWFTDLVKSISVEVANKYGNEISKDDVIDLTGISDITLEDMSSILLSKYVIKGVREGIVENNLFYDKDGKPIDIVDYNSLSEFVYSFSKDLNEDHNDKGNSNYMSVEELIKTSDNYTSVRSNEENHNKLEGATSYIKNAQFEKDRYDIARDIALRLLYDENNGKAHVNEQKKTLEGKVLINDALSKYQERASDVISKIRKNEENNFAIKTGLKEEDIKYARLYTSIKRKNEIATTFGSNLHNMEEAFFKELNNLKESSEELDLEEFKEKFIIFNVTDNDNKELFIKQIDSLVDFVKQIEDSNKGKKITYKAEMSLQSKELGLAAIADLVIIYDDAEFEVYDAKSKTGDFDNAWRYNINKFEKKGLSNISTSGRDKASLQTSIASLIIEANTGLIFRSNRALYYDVELENRQVNDGDKMVTVQVVKDVNLKKDRNNTYLSLNDYRSEILNSLDDDKKDFFRNTEEYKDDAVNTIPELMNYMLDGKILDIVDVEISAKKKMRRLDINPKDKDDVGFFSVKEKEINEEFVSVKKFISLTDKTDEERLELLKEHYADVNDKHTSFLNSIIEWTNTGVMPTDAGRSVHTNQMQQIVNTIPQGYIVKRLSDVKGMEEFKGTPMLIAEDPVTKDSVFVYVSNNKDTNITFNSDKKRTSIMGVDYADNIARVKFRDKGLREASKSNFRKVFIGLAALKMKEVNPNFKIERMYISAGMYVGSAPKALDIRTIMPVLKTVLTDNKANTSKPIARMKANISLFDVKSYKVDFVDNFKNIISSSAIIKDDKKDSLINSINAFQNFQMSLTDILDELMSIEKDMKWVIEKERGEDLSSNAEYVLLAKTVKDIFGITDSIINHKPKMLSQQIQRYTSLEHNVNDTMRQSLRRITSLFDLAIRRDFDTYEKKKNKMLDGMFESKNLSYKKKYLSQSMLEGYDNLFINKDNIDDPNTIMRLKDPDNMNDKSLNEKEREFIRFFNDQIYEQMKALYPAMFKDKVTEEEERAVTKGWVPIFQATLQTKQARMVKPDVSWDIQEQRLRPDRDSDESMKMDNDFNDLFKNHLYKAGYDTDNEIPREGFSFNENVETNLEYVLGRFVTKGIETKMHNYTLFAHNSMDVVMRGQGIMFGDKSLVESMLAELEDSVSMYVRNESPEKDTFGKVMDKASYVSSMAVIAFSSKQAVMDTLTYTFASSANAMSNVIYKWFGGRTDTLGYFDVKSWAKAGKLVMTQDPVVKEITRSFALDTDDSLVLSGDSRMKSMRKGMMEMGFIVTKEMAIATTVQVFIAGMMYDGSYDAYSVNKETGQLQYDEKKDRRLYDEKGKVKDENFLFAIKKEMVQEGQGIEEYDADKGNDDILDRKLTVGYTNKERTTIIYKSIDMIGAISKTTKIKAEQVLLFKYFLKFKVWIAAKKDLYTKANQLSDSFNEWERITHPDGRVEYRLDPQYTEGIIWSVVNIYNKFRAYGLKLENGGALTDMEKKNMAILSTHLVFLSSLVLLTMGLKMTCDEDKDFCWLDHSQVGKTTKSLIDNVKADQFIITALWDIATGRNSLFASVSIITGMAGRLGKLMFSVPFDGDEDVTWMSTFDEYTAKSWSTYRSTKEFMEIMDGFESVKTERADKKRASRARANAKKRSNKLYSNTAYTEAFAVDSNYDIDWNEVDWSGGGQ